jgi:hypothetical protein
MSMTVQEISSLPFLLKNFSSTSMLLPWHTVLSIEDTWRKNTESPQFVSQNMSFILSISNDIVCGVTFHLMSSWLKRQFLCPSFPSHITDCLSSIPSNSDTNSDYRLYTESVRQGRESRLHLKFRWWSVTDTVSWRVHCSLFSNWCLCIRSWYILGFRDDSFLFTAFISLWARELPVSRSSSSSSRGFQSQNQNANSDSCFLSLFLEPATIFFCNWLQWHLFSLFFLWNFVSRQEQTCTISTWIPSRISFDTRFHVQYWICVSQKVLSQGKEWHILFFNIMGVDVVSTKIVKCVVPAFSFFF